MFVDVRKCMRYVVERIDKPGVFTVDFLKRSKTLGDLSSLI